MLISCPKCRAVYDITDKKISPNGKKFKCAECGDIWTVYPSDENPSDADFASPDDSNVSSNKKAQTENKTTPVQSIDPNTDKDLNEMYNLLSRNTKALFASGSGIDSMNIFQRTKHYILNFISTYVIIAFLMPISIILAGILLYRYRYEVSAKIPGMDYVYTKMNFDSLYRGKDLTIEDVNIRNIRVKGHSKLEISGRIFNNGNHIVTLLPIKARIIDKDNQTVDEQTERLKERQLEPSFSALFRIVMERPNKQAEKIRLSLEKD